MATRGLAALPGSRGRLGGRSRVDPRGRPSPPDRAYSSEAHRVSAVRARERQSWRQRVHRVPRIPGAIVSRNLEGKVVIVAGAGPGIGRSAALALARDGADLLVAARHVQHSPPPKGGCPRCLHEFTCSRTPQHERHCRRAPSALSATAAARCLKMPTPRHGHRHRPHLAAGLRQWRPPLPEDLNSRDPPSGDPFE